MLASVAVDHVVVTVDAEMTPEGLEDDASFPVWPEDILAVFDHAEDAEDALARLAGRLDAGSEAADMEPNQALAVAKAHFPAEARLRRAGYRLAEKVLTLTFDFPDVVLETYAAEIEALAAETGWQIEVAPEANQAALNALATECLPDGWIVRKGPSIHRVERRVSMTVAPDMNAAFDPEPKLLDDAEDRFAEISGYTLEDRRCRPRRDAAAQAGDCGRRTDGDQRRLCRDPAGAGRQQPLSHQPQGRRDRALLHLAPGGRTLS